jgi:hypothetical protein
MLPARVGGACDARRVDDAATYAIELAVGLVTLIAGVGVGRGSGPRWLAWVLVVAGVAACAHALAELAG